MQFSEGGEAGLDDGVRPLVDLGVDVAVAADGGLDRLLDDVAHLVHHELGLQKGSGLRSTRVRGCAASQIYLFRRFVGHFGALQQG